MAKRKIDKLVKMGDHPLEKFFNIEENTTEIVEYKSKIELEEYDDYDNKDKELENDFQIIMEKALDLADVLKGQIESNQEPKYLARLAEVTAQQYGIALNAAEKKAKLKDNKDKLNQKKSSTVKNTYNQTVIMDRNSMLDAIMERSEDDTDDIDDAEFIEIGHDKDE